MTESSEPHPSPLREEEALALHSHAQVLQAGGQHDQAVPTFASAAEYFAAADGAQSLDLANILADQAESLLALCRYDDAEEKARRSKDIMEAIRHQLDPAARGMLVPHALAVWGRTLRELGRYEEAASPVLEAIREAEECLGKDHLETARFLNEYGILCKYWRHFDEGEGYYLRA